MDKKKIGIVCAVVVVLFLFLGLVWPGFLTGKNAATTTPAVVAQAQEAVENAANEAAEAVQQTVEQAGEAVQQAVEGAAETVQQTVEDATNK